jgi:cyclophilin family peptidyl-prolyl cis-trans isomerase
MKSGLRFVKWAKRGKRYMGRQTTPQKRSALNRRLACEELEDRRLLSITLPTISNVSLAAGTTLYVPLNGASAGQTVSYSVTASDYSKVTPLMMPSSNQDIQMLVRINGIDKRMTFQLFDEFAPNTAAKIEALVDSGYYNGLEIYRNWKDSSNTPLCLQGGNCDPTYGTIKSTPIVPSIAEEFNPNLQFTGAGLLAMARTSTASTSSSEFFLTESAISTVRSSLDYNYTIFGFQTSGYDVVNTIAAMANKPGSSVGYLQTPVSITSASLITDTQNGVLQLSAPKGVTGTVAITVMASDETGATVMRTFNVTIAADSSSNPANPFSAKIPAAPTSVSFVPPVGSSNATDLDHSLLFQVSGVTAGNVVEILADGNVVGKVTASATTANVTTDSTIFFSDGAHKFTAIQVAMDQTVVVNEMNGSSTTALNKTADVPSLSSPAVEVTIGKSIVLSNSIVPENQPAGTVVGTLGTLDADASDTFTYSLFSGQGSTDNAQFKISGNSLLTNASFDYEAVTDHAYSVRIRSTDQHGLFTEKAFTIGVTDVNVPVIWGVVVVEAGTPKNGKLESNEKLKMTWAVSSERPIASSILTVDGRTISGIGGPYSKLYYSCTIGTWSAGTHAYVITAVDKTGASFSQSGTIDVTLATPPTPPSVFSPAVGEADKPKNGVFESNERLVITWGATSQNRIASQSVTVDGRAIAATVSGPFAKQYYSCPIGAWSAGTHGYTVTAVDSKGISSTISGAFNVKAAVPMPWTIDSVVVAEASATKDGKLDPSDPLKITWAATAQSGILSQTITVDGRTISSVSGPFSKQYYSCLIGAWSAGTHTYVITATDKKKAVYSKSGTFVVAAASSPAAQRASLLAAVMQEMGSPLGDSDASADGLTGVMFPLGRP